MGLNSPLWLGSAQIRERYLALRDGRTALVRNTQGQANIQQSLKDLNALLVDHFTSVCYPVIAFYGGFTNVCGWRI